MTTSITTAAVGAAALGAAALASAPAAAATMIGGGETRVTVTADLAALGLGGAPFGSASVAIEGGSPVFTFPITGGTLSPDLRIEHDGSGVTLTALADNSLSATIGNFVIADGAISGDVIGGPSGVTFFSLGAATTDGIPMSISGDLAGALTSVFSAPDLSDAVFGYASTAPTAAPVPLPAAGAMLLGGLAVLGAAAGRRRSA